MKLKTIIQENGLGGFGEIQKEKMSQEQKKQLLSMVSQYNECGKQLYGYGDVRQISEALLKISELAERYALEESDEDMLQTKTIHEDMKSVRKDAAEMHKIAKEAWVANERLKALYENIGGKLSRYYEIN
jgi:hypothetical protein